MPNTLFISYRRRGESTGYAGRLADRLKRAFGEEEYFRDLDDIKPGTDFGDAIDEHMACCKVLLVIIGTDWLTLADATGRQRLSDPRDWVRLEVAAALKRKALVLPVLVGGATMPSDEDLPDDLKVLARRQAIDLSDSRWDYDVEQLLNRIVETVGLKYRLSTPSVPPQRPRWHGIVKWGGAGLVGLIILGMIIGILTPPEDPTLSYRPGLEAAIRRGDAAEIQALREVDERYLDAAFTGRALDEQRASVKALRDAKQFAVLQLDSQFFNSFAVTPEGSRAEVQVVETWRMAFHSTPSEACVDRWPRLRTPQTIFLTNTTTGWLIDSIEHYTAVPARVPCRADD